MKRLKILAALAGLLCVSVPAFADVTVRMTTSMIMTGPSTVSMEMTTVTYVKGTSSRTDVKGPGSDLSVYVDAATNERLIVDHLKKQVMTELPMPAMPAGFTDAMGTPTVSITPTGNTREVLGRSCEGLTLAMSLPMTLGGETVSINMTGTIWVANDGPGTAEWAAFAKAAAASGLYTNLLRTSLPIPGMDQLVKLTAYDGLALEQDARVTLEGAGPMAQAMAQVGGVGATISMKATEVSVAPIADDVFVVPAGYEKK
jgi:hypothetical protein